LREEQSIWGKVWG